MNTHHRNYAIGGLSASGKTSVGAELLLLLQTQCPPADDEPEWIVVDLGDIARARAERLGVAIEEEAADRPSAVDLAIEEVARETFRRGNSIVLGRLPWMVASEPQFSADAFRIWIDAEPETRAGRRAAQPGHGPYDEVLVKLCGRDDSDAARYTRVYKDRGLIFPPAAPFNMFDLVVSAEKLRQPEIAELVVRCSQLLKTAGPDSYFKFHS